MANLRAEAKEYCNIDVTNGNLFTMSEDKNETGVIIPLTHYPESTNKQDNSSHMKDSEIDPDDISEGDPSQTDEGDRCQTDADDKKGKDKFNVECMTYELQVGYRILSNIMSAGNRCLNKLFLFPVDDTFPETADYYNKIKEPMWMFKMKEKFEKQEYKDLTEFITDFRLMIENCYRFNGPDHFVSKKAQKLETMMKQKVALLSKDLRDKIAGASMTNGEDDILASAGLRRRVRNPNASHDDPSQQLLSQLRRDRELQERVDRRQKVEDRKAMECARIQEIQNWEDSLLGPEIKDQIRTMWELPQIGLFVYLCMESLGLEEEVTQYQIERGLAVPRECSDFRRLMTCLLSTPNQRKSLKSFMPYHVWNSKLSKKLDHFYKVLSDKNGNQAQTCYYLGLDTRAFKVMGKRNPLLKKQFHQLSYLKRVWILKNFCDYCMETQPALQKTIDDAEAQRPNDVREVVLGSDSRGYRYINFPMFTGKDIRIYRHAKYPEPSLESLSMEDWSVEPDSKISASSSRCSTPVNRRNNRMVETPSTSLRARVLLQAAESVETSPARDISRSGSEAPDPSSVGGNKTKPTNSKKRKHSSLFFTKRKRLKPIKKNEVGTKEDAGDFSPPSLKPKDGSTRIDGATFCDKLAYVQNSSRCDSPDKLNCNVLASSETDTLNKIKADHSNNSSHLSPSAMLTSYVDPGTLSQDIDSCSTQGLLLSSGHQSGNCDSADGKINVIKCESNGRKSCVSGVEMAERNSLNTSGVESEINLMQEEDMICDPVTPIKQELSPINNKNLSGTESNMKQELGDRNVCKLKSELVDDKSSLGCSSENGKENIAGLQNGVHKLRMLQDGSCGIDVKAGDLLQDAVKPEGPGHTMGGSHSAPNNRDQEVKSEPVNEEEEKKDVNMAEPEQEEDSDEEDLPDLGEIELVAENMEEIRELIKKLSNPDPVKKGKKVIPGVMKPCEEELVAVVSRFHDELSKYERSLVNARVGMQAKLRKEVESYVEPKIEEVKAWDSDPSQSSSEESEEENVSKVETSTSKPPKKTRQKAATTALLTSAASKLSSLTGEENCDSNDSFELDISSRGRLRKRRVIPNNTEDTGLKKRKNLPNQDAFFSTPPAVPSVTTSAGTGGQMALPSSGHQQLGNLVAAAQVTNSAIKAQLAAQATRAPGQIVRQVITSDAGIKTILAENLTSPNLPNIRFVSGVKSAVSSRSVIRASPAQSSHPVIQQLLLNQTKPTSQSAAATSKSVSETSRLLQRHFLGLPEASRISSKVSTDLSTRASVNSLSAATGSYIMPPKPATLVVTQVSTSVSQEGTPVVDLGSLTFGQLKQLEENQAIQINTSTGGTTTLFLTTGLQHLTTTRATGASVSPAAITALEPAGGLHNPSISVVPSGAVIKKSQVVVTNKPNSWLTIPTQIPTQVVRTPAVSASLQAGKTNIQSIPSSQVHISQGLNNAAVVSAALQTALSRTVTLSAQTPGTILINPSQFTSVPKTISNPAFSHISLAQKSILAPRIISSLAATGSSRAALATSSAAVLQKSVPSSVVANGCSSVTISPEMLKSKIISVPLVHLSPSKKYASNVTVKTLIENQNRGTRRGSEEEGCLASAGESLTVCESNLQVAARESSGNELTSGPIVESLIEGQVNGGQVEAGSKVIAVSPVDVQTLIRVDGSGQGQGSAKSPQTAVVPFTRPLWVDTTIQSLTSTTACSTEIMIPTMNIKVPSPNTLPSLHHNKDGTTIVHSTKAPIPVASEAKSGDSLSPSLVPLTENIPQGAMFQTAQLARKVQLTASNLAIMPANIKSPTAAVGSTIKLPAGIAGMKNVTVKITPQAGSSSGGQFVQGFMTSQGLVIPQTALLQPGLQSSNIILGKSPQAGTIAQLHTDQMKIQTGAVLGISGQQSMQNLGAQLGQAVTQQLQHQQLAPQKMLAAASGSLTPSGNLQTAITNQNVNSGLKIMLVTPPVAAANGGVTSPASLNVQGRQQQKAIAAPASELVKQIASSSQVQGVSNQQVNLNPVAPGTGQTNAAYLLNSIIQGSALKPASSQVTPMVAGLPTSHAVVKSQLTGQVLSLQHNSQLTQQYKPSIVLAAKPAQNTVSSSSSTSSSQNKSSVVTFQVQHLGQLISNLGGVTKLQMDGSSPSASTQVVSVQKQAGPGAGQPNQVVQLAINQSAVGSPQPSQVVRVAGQLSPQQLQLQNSGLAKIQQPGNIIVQQQTLLPQQQQQPQNFIIQQPGLSPAVIGANNVSIQLSAAQPPGATIQQQQLSKSLQQPASCLTPSAVNKLQLNTSGQITSQQLLSISQNPGLLLSHLQVPTAATTIASQPQIQFVINSSSASNSSLPIRNTSLLSSSNLAPVSADSSIRSHPADLSSSLTGLNSHSANISGIHVLSPPGNTSHALITGNSAVSANSTPSTNKVASHVMIPNSAAGKYLISPVRVSPQNSQVSAVKYVSAVQAQNPGSELALNTSNLAVGVGQLPGSSLADGRNQASARPAVIFAGHQASEKKEGKIAQILLSQPLTASLPQPQAVVSNQLMPGSVVKLPVGTAGLPSSLGTDLGTSLNSKPLLYKIGDQYFTSLQQVVSQTTRVASDGTSGSSNQHLVPPSFIEASDQILNQVSKSVTAQTTLKSTTAPGSTTGNPPQDVHHGIILQPASGDGSIVDITKQVPVNGFYQNKPRFSFSLSGPACISRSDGVLNSSATVSSQMVPSALNPSEGGYHPQKQSYVQGQYLASAEISSVAAASDAVAARRNTLNGGPNVSSKDALPTRHLSVDDSALTLEDQDEKEAALNLLTLANQPI